MLIYKSNIILHINKRKIRISTQGAIIMFEKISQKLIGYRVKAARIAAGLTQDQLTQGLGLNDRQSVSDIENGKRAKAG